eukprot:TRINITY_DN30354_c0_g1_i2.p1 TRINITY_DN30354_c0_g1~~TRINITY_DN30354_c0_g1_i2.p1  ORF type:complete len:474 (+),score=181.85 TRINITY_DN30354_c0_g1_i2:48-1469(+)
MSADARESSPAARRARRPGAAASPGRSLSPKRSDSLLAAAGRRGVGQTLKGEKVQRELLASSEHRAWVGLRQAHAAVAEKARRRRLSATPAAAQRTRLQSPPNSRAGRQSPPSPRGAGQRTPPGSRAGNRQSPPRSRADGQRSPSQPCAEGRPSGGRLSPPPPAASPPASAPMPRRQSGGVHRTDSAAEPHPDMWPRQLRARAPSLVSSPATAPKRRSATPPARRGPVPVQQPEPLSPRSAGDPQEVMELRLRVAESARDTAEKEVERVRRLVDIWRERAEVAEGALARSGASMAEVQELRQALGSRDDELRRQHDELRLAQRLRDEAAELAAALQRQQQHTMALQIDARERDRLHDEMRAVQQSCLRAEAQRDAAQRQRDAAEAEAAEATELLRAAVAQLQEASAGVAAEAAELLSDSAAAAPPATAKARTPWKRRPDVAAAVADAVAQRAQQALMYRYLLRLAQSVRRASQ